MKYTLTHYKRADESQALCEHAERIPGLDADTCAICSTYWPHKGVQGRIEYRGIQPKVNLTENLLEVAT